MAGEQRPRPPHDLRLLPVLLGLALGCWWATAPQPDSLPLSTRVLAAAALAMVPPLAYALVRPVATAHRWPLLGLLVVGALLAGLVLGGLRSSDLPERPLSLLARSRADVTFTGTVESVRRAGGNVHGDHRTRELCLVELHLASLASGTQRWRVSATTTLLAPVSWSSLAPGTQVTGAGRAEPSTQAPRQVLLAVTEPPLVTSPPGGVGLLVAEIREGMREAVHPLPPGPAGLLPGLVLGDTSGLDPETAAAFKVTGLTHLVAVSGGNLAIVSAAVLGLLLSCRVRRRPAIAGAALAMLGYVVVVGPEPSVLRAAAMAAIAVGGLLAGRARETLPTLLAAASLLLAVDPHLARSYGFALSVLATAGLLTWSGSWTRALAGLLQSHVPLLFASRRVATGAAASVCVPAAAQVAVSPVLVLLQPTLSLVSIPANLVAAVAVAPATLLGLLTAVLAPVCLPLATALAWCAQWPARLILAAADIGSRVPGGTLPWVPGVAGALLLVLLVALVAIGLRVGRRAGVRDRLRPLAAACLPVVLTGGLAGIPAVVRLRPAPWPPPDWAVIACDVGQGDGLLVRTGPDAAAVVDTGPDPAAMKACLTRVGVTHLSLLLLTHLHADHVEGVPGVLAVARPDQVLTGPLDEPQSEGRRVRQWLREEGLQAATAPVGDAFAIGNSTWEFLWPRRVIPGDEGSEPNNASVVAVVHTPAVSVLLTGDVEPEAQRALRAELADRLGESGVDVLKVPHHGSAYQDSAFLAATQARLALISVGAGNDYGHPAPSTVATLSRLGMRVERTDLAGGIAVVRRGGELLVSPQRREDQESE